MPTKLRTSRPKHIKYFCKERLIFKDVDGNTICEMDVERATNNNARICTSDVAQNEFNSIPNSVYAEYWQRDLYTGWTGRYRITKA